MPLLSLIVGVDLYKDLEVPDGCTVSKWKDLLGQGFLGDKILYSGKLTCHEEKGNKTLENAALLPEPPDRMFVGGPGSVVKMLELALKKKLGAPLSRVINKDRNVGAQSGFQHSPAFDNAHAAKEAQFERRPSLPISVPVVGQEQRSPPVFRGQAPLRSSGSDELLRYWCAGMQGMRPYMEDRTCAFLQLPGYEKVALFGTFDGHGGYEVSDLTASTFPRILAGLLNEGLAPREALLEAFRVWDEDLLALHASASPHPYDRTGSTAVVCLLLREEMRMLCANCGDSRAVLAVSKGTFRAVELSTDQKPQNPGERARIEAAGGKVELWGPCWRIDKGLNVSRSLGDFAYKSNRSCPAYEQKVIAVPEITEHVIDEDAQFVVMGSDGVFDVHTSEALVKSLQEGHKSGLSWEQVVDGALSRSLASGDNVTICMFEFVRTNDHHP